MEWQNLYLWLLIGLVASVILLIWVISAFFRKKAQLQNMTFLLKENELTVKNLEKNFDILNVENAALREELKNFQEIHHNLTTQLATLHTKKDYTEQQWLGARQDIDSLQTQLEHYRTASIQLEEALSQIRIKNLEINELKEKNNLLQESNSHLKAREAVHEKEITILQDQLKTQQLTFHELHQKAHEQFSLLSSKILEEKSATFTQLNKLNIEQILAPLNEQIKEFREKLGAQHSEEIKYRHSLNDRIRELIENTQKVSAEANHLATALKGQNKLQGDWGEMILENILESSGLEKNREYFVQTSHRNEESHLIRPDILVKLPGDRKVIIDAKVSLTGYEKYSHEKDTNKRQESLEQHLRSIRQHIQQLSDKKYEAIEGSLDFVMLFIPVEPAYVIALQADPNLWNFAYRKKIILMSPTNIVAALKLIHELWRRELQHHNALAIAEQAEKMHQKLVSFLNEFDEVGQQIEQSHQKYLKAQKLLVSGRGNLMTQLDQLKSMGVQSKKDIKNISNWKSDEKEEL